MMSASAMSAAIRAKKKKMEEDESGAVKLSGIPMDATDIDVIKQKEYGEMLSENKPMERDEMPSIESEMAEEKKAQPHNEMAEDPELDAMKKDKSERMGKIKSMMMRMK